MSIGIWQHQGTILTGAEKPFLPTVIYEGGSQCGLGAGNVFKMWYSGTANTYYAESLDGKTSWTKYASNPIVSGQVLGKLFKNGSTYYLYTSPSTQNAINVYTSSDGVTFSLAKANAIVPTGGAWDSTHTVQLSVVEVVGGVWTAYYAGQGTGHAGWWMGLATSTDGINWSKVGSTGAITYEGVSDFCFQKVGSTYYGWSQIATPNVPGGVSTLPSDIMRFSASSSAGPWTPLGSLTFYRTQTSEGINFHYGQVADPCLISVGGTLYFYFTQSPDGNTATTFTIGLATAPSTTLTQLVTTYEGIQNVPIPNPSAIPVFVCPQLSVLASDNFQRADANPIGGNWTPIGAPTNFGPAQLKSHALEPVTTNCDSWWNAFVWPNDQWAQVTIGAFTTANIGIDLRSDKVGAGTVYRLYGQSSGNWSIQRVINNFGTGTIAVASGTGATGRTFATGDVITSCIVGTTISFYQNGDLFAVATDASIASGSAGALAYAGATPANGTITAWSGGSPQDPLFGVQGSLGVAGAGATVAWTGDSSGSVIADGSGNYNTGEALLPFGSYTITPSKTGYTFSPTSASETVSGADITGVNFAATQSTVATPTFSPAAGTYTSAQTVTVSCTDHALSGFAMYWNTTGSPTTGSMPIANGGTIVVSASETIYVLAVATGYANSSIGSAAYVISIAPSHYSVPDCRVAPFGPNTGVTVQGTVQYTGQTSSNPAIPPTDSRAAGAPVDSRLSANKPQNSRTPGTFGPGE